MKNKNIVLALCLMSLTTLFSGCEPETVEPVKIVIKECDPSQGGTGTTCAALSDDTLYFAGNNGGTGYCHIGTDYQDFYIITVNGVRYPQSRLTYADRFTALLDFRPLLRTGLCGF